MTNVQPLLEMNNLSVTFPSEAGPVHAVRGLSYHVMPGEILGIVGESGSGKSVSSLAVMGLLPARARIATTHAVGWNTATPGRRADASGTSAERSCDSSWKRE